MGTGKREKKRKHRCSVSKIFSSETRMLPVFHSTTLLGVWVSNQQAICQTAVLQLPSLCENWPGLSDCRRSRQCTGGQALWVADEQNLQYTEQRA